MIKIEVLEQHIAELDDNAFAKLHEWFIEFDQVRWDKKLEADSNAGKLYFLINATLKGKNHVNTTNHPSRM